MPTSVPAIGDVAVTPRRAPAVDDERAAARLARLEERRVQSKRRARRRTILIHVAQLATVAVVIAAWQLRGRSTKAWRLLIATPTDVVSVLHEWAGDHERWGDLWLTVKEAGLGYLLGAVAAVILGSLLGSNQFLAKVVTPFITALQALPKLALAPLFIVWFGSNTHQRVYFISSVGFFVVFWSIFVGLVGIDRVVLMNARVLGARRWWLLREVYAPAMLGWVITSLRIGLAFSLLSSAIAELLSSQDGIGARIRQAQNTLDTPSVLAGVFSLTIVALILDRTLVRVQRRFSPWRLT